MGNYIVNNSKFQPFTYQEMLQPVLMADQAHREVEAGLADLSAKSSVWDKMTDPIKDSKAHSLYQNYADNLKDAVSDLAANGLNPQTRQTLLNLKSRYSTDIVPIEQAYTQRQKEAQEQKESMLRNPTMRYSRDASNTSLDEYLNNPSMGYKALAGNELAQEVASQAKNLSRLSRDNPQEFRKIFGGAYFQIVDKNGFSEKEVSKAISGDKDANPVLLQIVDNVLKGSGVDSWSDPHTKAQLRSIASTGLMEAIGDAKSRELDNWPLKLQMEEAMRKRAEKEQKASETAPLNYTLSAKTGIDQNSVHGLDYNQFTNDRAFVDKVTRDPRFLDPNADDKQDKSTSLQDRFKQIREHRENPYLYEQTHPTSSGAKENITKAAQLMKKYGVTNINDLPKRMDEVAAKTAFVRNNYQFEVTKTGLALDKLRDRFNSYEGYNGNTGIQSIKGDGSLGSFKSNSTVGEIFDNTKGPLTINYNTGADRFELVKNGDRYAFDINVIDPSGEIQRDVQTLKTLNPTQGNMSNTTEFIDKAAAYQQRANLMNQKVGLLLNQFAKTQGETMSGKQ